MAVDVRAVPTLELPTRPPGRPPDAARPRTLCRTRSRAVYRRTDLFERRRKLMVDEVNPIRPTRFEDPKAGPFG